MAKCEWCGEKFDRVEAEEIFEDEFSLDYSNIKKCLCGACAIQAIEDLVDDVYFEKCDSCGKVFDLIEEESDFEQVVSGTTLRDYWGSSILCKECALKEIG